MNDLPPFARRICVRDVARNQRWDPSALKVSDGKSNLAQHLRGAAVAQIDVQRNRVAPLAHY
jgi:hypothetical protein